MLSSPKRLLLGCLLRVDQTPLLPPEAGLNLNLILISLISGSPKFVPKPFQVPLCNQNSPLYLTGRKDLSPWINTVWWCLEWAALLTHQGH
jgi:hypothetical protein